MKLLSVASVNARFAATRHRQARLAHRKRIQKEKERSRDRIAQCTSAFVKLTFVPVLYARFCCFVDAAHTRFRS